MSRLTASARSVPQVEVMATLCFCQVGTAMVQVAVTSMCSTATWLAPSDLADERGHVGRFDPGGSRAGVDLLGQQVVGEDRLRGPTTLAANRASSTAAASAAASFTRTLPERYRAAGTSWSLAGSSKTRVPRRLRASAGVDGEEGGHTF